MAPPRKPAERRQRRATKDVGVVVALASAEPPPPHPDRHKLLAVTVKAWSTFWSSDLAGLVQPADMQALGRLFRMYDLRERMERALLAQPFTTGSTGQLVAHPAAKEIASLDGRIVALEDRFGLTPAGRLKLGIVFGAAARSLEDLNRGFDDDDEAHEDPRVRAIDTTTA